MRNQGLFHKTAHVDGVGVAMRLELPDHIVKRAEANAADLLLSLAIQLYSDNRLDYVDARTLSGMTGENFNRELLDRGLSINAYPDIGEPPKSYRQAG